MAPIQPLEQWARFITFRLVIAPARRTSKLMLIIITVITEKKNVISLQSFLILVQPLEIQLTLQKKKPPLVTL